MWSFCNRGCGNWPALFLCSLCSFLPNPKKNCDSEGALSSDSEVRRNPLVWGAKWYEEVPFPLKTLQRENNLWLWPRSSTLSLLTHCLIMIDDRRASYYEFSKPGLLRKVSQVFQVFRWESRSLKLHFIWKGRWGGADFTIFRLWWYNQHKWHSKRLPDRRSAFRKPCWG